MESQFVSALQSNNLESLIALFKATPTRDTINDILEAYKSYNATLAALQTSPDVPEVVLKQDDGAETRESLDRVFNHSLFETIKDILHGELDNEVTAANLYLVASIISGSIKTKACFSSDQVGEITVGLQFETSEHTAYFGPAEYEIKAVGALIGVLSAAKGILGLKRLRENDLKEGVKRIEGVITSDAGKRICKAATELAQNGFKDAWDSKDIWALLG